MLNIVPVSDNKITLPFGVDKLHIVHVAVVILMPAIFILLTSWSAAGGTRVGWHKSRVVLVVVVGIVCWPIHGGRSKGSIFKLGRLANYSMSSYF